MDGRSDHIRGRFPRTPHLVLGPISGKAVTRDDLTLTPQEANDFLFVDRHAATAAENHRDDDGAATAAASSSVGPSSSLHLVVEEKLDGANLGLGLAADGGTIVAQNRSHFVNGATAPQWNGLPRFIDEAREELLRLFYALPADADAVRAVTAPLLAHTGLAASVGPGGYGQPPRVDATVRAAAAASSSSSGAAEYEVASSENPACDWMVFGEWLGYQHSVFYDALPSVFIVFDIYHCPSQRFLAAGLRDRLIADHCPSLVTSARVYAGPLQPTPTSKRANGGAAGGKGPKSTSAGSASATSATPITSWEDFFQRWHRRPSKFFADLGAKARDSSSSSSSMPTGKAATVRQMEGVVLRVDDVVGGFQLMRCKAVHDEFVAAIDDHWRKQAPVKNIVVGRHE